MNHKSLLVWSLILTMLLVPFAQSYGAYPTDVFPDSGTLVSNYQFELLGYSPVTYVKFGTNFYADDIFVHDTHVNFTNTALASVSAPTKYFGIGVKNGNATVTSVQTGAVTLSMSCTAAARCDAFYYHTVPVQAVKVNNTTIQSASFYTNFNTFNASSSPAVYQNTTGKYLQTKVVYSNPTTITFYSGTFIYADLGAPDNILSIKIYKPDATAIPYSIDVYLSNSTTNWGSPVVSNRTLTQSVSYEEIEFTDTVAQYAKVEVNTFGTADIVKFGELDIMLVTTTTQQSAWSGGINDFMTSFYVAMGLAVLGVFIYIIKEVRD